MMFFEGMFFNKFKKNKLIKFVYYFNIKCLLCVLFYS